MRGMRLTAIFMVIAVLATLILGPSSRAGLVDDWLTQKTETSPGYFEGQKRGYYTAGNFSARWPHGSDYPLSVTPPKVRAGCGGIDAFMGGFSFLNADYLVQKLQRMIQAAPAIAFDVALSVLTKQLPDSMKNFEKIINDLNKIQIDECTVSKELVATIAPPGLQDNKGTLAKNLGSFAQDSGLKDLWTDTQKLFSANNNSAAGTAVSSAAADKTSGNMSACPQDVKDILGDTGSVIDKMTAKFGSSDYADTIRGALGDIYIVNNNDGTYSVAYKAPCEENKDVIKNLLAGKTQLMSTNWTCTQNTDPGLSNWAMGKMASIASKYGAKVALDPDEQAFVDSNPLPIGIITKYAVGTSQQGAVLAPLSDVTAKAYAYQIALEFYYRIASITEKARQVMTAHKNAVPGSPESKCQVSMLGDAELEINNMEGMVKSMIADLRRSYVALVKETDAVMRVADRLQKFDDMAGKYLSQGFSPSLATRAVGR